MSTTDPSASGCEPEDVYQARQHLFDASDSAYFGHVNTQNLADIQTTAKWGVQYGPVAFMDAYRDKLTDWASQIAWIQAQIDGLSQGVQTVANALTDTDSQAANQLNQIKNSVAAQETANSTGPSAPTAPTPPTCSTTPDTSDTTPSATSPQQTGSYSAPQ